MNWYIRRLDPNTDEQLFEQMYDWLVGGPVWLRQCEAAWGPTDHDNYLAATHGEHRVDIGIFVADTLQACVTLTCATPNIYEVHLGARQGTNLRLIVQAGWAIRDQLFGEYGAEEVFLWTPRWNRPVRNAIKAIGFTPTNVTMWRGTYRGRLIEWVGYSIARSSYGRQ